MLKYTLYSNFITIIFLLFSTNAKSKEISKEISFDYVQASYISDTINLNGSASDIDGNGIGFLLSLGFSPAFALKLSVDATTFDTFQTISVETTKTTTLGVTAHTTVASKVDIYTNVSAVKAEVTIKNGEEEISDDDIGFLVSAGLRHKLSDVFEIDLSVSHSKVFGYTENSFMADGRIYIHERLSLGFGFVAGDSVDSLLLTGRMDI